MFSTELCPDTLLNQALSLDLSTVFIIGFDQDNGLHILTHQSDPQKDLALVNIADSIIRAYIVNACKLITYGAIAE